MSIYSPEADWLRPPHGAERVWIGLAFTWCLIMFIAMPYWHFYGKQNSTGESYRVQPGAFAQRVQQFVATHRVGDMNGIRFFVATDPLQAWEAFASSLHGDEVVLVKGSRGVRLEEIVDRLAERFGEGLHLVALAADDIAEAKAAMQANGTRIIEKRP